MSANSPSPTAANLDIAKARFNMVEQQVRPWDVADSAVLGLLSSLPREEFVPAAFRSMAFADLDIPLTTPAEPGKSMLPPKVQARLLQDAAVQATETVLEIGTGSGYMAAMLGSQAKAVRSIEIDGNRLHRPGTTSSAQASPTWMWFMPMRRRKVSGLAKPTHRSTSSSWEARWLRYPLTC